MNTERDFFPCRVKIIGPFDAAERHSRYTLLCEDRVYLYSNDQVRDGTKLFAVYVKVSLCSRPWLELKCDETLSPGHNGNDLARIEFWGCQLCLMSKTKFEMISSQADTCDEVFRAHLLNVLSDDNIVDLEWYVCNERGQHSVRW